MLFTRSRAIIGSISKWTAVAGLLAVLAAPSQASEPSFNLVGTLPGQYTEVFGVSTDGQTGVGYSNGTSNARGFRWTPSQGRLDFDRIEFAQVRAVSQEGTVIIGTAVDPADGRPLGVRKVGNNPVQILFSDYGGADGCSRDGSVVVGYSGENGAKWRSSGGVQILGGLADVSQLRAFGVENSGGLTVGRGYVNSIGGFVAVTWDEAGIASRLPSLDGSLNFSSEARGISGDGAWTVGFTDTASGLARAVRWSRQGVPENLGVLPGFLDSLANAATDDGRTIVGSCQGGSNTAMIWREGIGMAPLAAYLASNGVSVPAGYRLYECWAVSSDGQSFGGTALAPDGHTGIGFVATIPTPASLCLLALSSLPASLSWRRRPPSF